GDAGLDAIVRRYVARLTLKGSSCARQAPLLPESLAAGVCLGINRRGPECEAGLLGAAAAGSARGGGGSVCVLAVRETSLVHYTKRPGAVARGSGAGAASAAARDAAAALPGGPPPVEEKYWKRRFNYFSRFDEGVRMDVAAWFEVTPESVSRHIADRMPYGLVVDGTCGVGGNAIQFALSSQRVVAVDIDASRLEDAAHNACVYGVQDRIEFVHDDFIHWAETYQGPTVDAVFLSPPWGGPAHLDCECFSLRDVECPDIVRMFAAAASVSRRVALYLPRHQDLLEIVTLASSFGFSAVEVEKIFFQYPTPHLKLCIVWFTPEAALVPPPPPTAAKVVGPATQRRAARGDAESAPQPLACRAALAWLFSDLP
ncbi:unnamed protein product, partial [Prorocentrum cordatum]